MKLVYPLASLVAAATAQRPTFSGYYDDTTSTSRTFGWMTPDFENAGIQNVGAWDTDFSAIPLGNGRTSSGAANQAFIDAVKASMIAAGHTGQAKQSEPGLGPDLWNHIRNFWYRDGDLFALMEDDRAYDLMGGGCESFDSNNNCAWGGAGHQHGQIFTYEDEDGNQKYEVKYQAHSIEYLRDFCEEMGGNLWAPSSQHEYDDVIERPNGMCHNFGRHKYDGALTNPSTVRTKVFLNMHREGYQNIPDGYETGTTSAEANPDGVFLRWQTKTGGSAAGTRQTSASDLDAFWTTDYWFADTTADICANTVPEMEYSLFTTDAANSATCDDGQAVAPFLDENCWSTVPGRFQKFSKAEYVVLNNFLASQTNDQSQIVQKDCVLLKCEGHTEDTTDPADPRYPSEWNMVPCNQHKWVGICRIKATGCVDSTSIACKTGYDTTCNDHAVHTETTQTLTWANDEVEAAANALTPAPATPSFDMTVIAGAATTTQDCMTTVPAGGDAFWTESGLVDAATAGIATCTQATTDTCSCSCQGYTAIEAVGVEGVTGITTVTSADTAVEGATETYTCDDQGGHGCISGSAAASCGFNAGGTQLVWTFDAGTPAVTSAAAGWDAGITIPDMCANSCCDSYDAAFTAAFQGTPATVYQEGDTYTLECTGGTHILGEAETVTSADFVVGNDLGNCYDSITCVEKECQTCPTMANGHCYDTAALYSPVTGSWASGDTLRCRCDRCFAMTGAASNLPFEDRTCGPDGTDMNFDDGVGTCVPVQCANPFDLLEGGVTVGWPTSSKAGCGESITYECAEGYAPAGGVAPTSTCTDSAPTQTTGDFGKQGFFSAIVGSCVPVACTGRPDTPANAWDAVMFNAGIPADCHAAVDTTVAGFVADQTAAAYALGSEAVFECYDDFDAVAKADYASLVYDHAEESGCAVNSDDGCRTEQTDALFTQNAADNTVGVITNNGRVVSRCINGAWTTPSHECVCEDAQARRNAAVSAYYSTYFDAVCDMPGSSSNRLYWSALFAVPYFLFE